MRNPYVVGGWVSGREHYGREALIQHILTSPNDAVWVVGNRRIGKTSLLRQLEFLTSEHETYIPLYWDMQGSATLKDLGTELLFAIEDEAERFQRLEVDLDLLRSLDPASFIRLLRRYARAADRVLLLLCDEAEALIEIAKSDPDGLAGLRRVLQSGMGLRVVMAATKVLSQVNDLTGDWPTSPFLFGFGLRNLAGLDNQEATDLIRQVQDAEPVRVEDDLVQEIRLLTNNHPYLIQLLCNRLFDEEGFLRPVTQEDLALESTLEGFFQSDFRWLSPGERQVLLSVAAGHDTLDAIVADTGLHPVEAQEFVYSQQRLGLLRHMGEAEQVRLAVGNSFLERWLQSHHEALQAESHESEVTDRSTLDLVREGQMQEAQYVQEQLQIQLANLRELERQRAQYGLRIPLDLVNDINRVRMEIRRLEERLALILPEVVDAVWDEEPRPSPSSE